MNNTFYKTSETTGKTYDVFDGITIMNAWQAAFYCANGVELQDLKLSEDRKTGDPVFCYIFKREDTREAYDKWCKRKERKNDKAGFDRQFDKQDRNGSF